MKLYFPQAENVDTLHYTYQVVATAFRRRGHEIETADPAGCDAALFSICDVTEMARLKRFKKSLDIPVIVGGSYAFNYWSAILYSDAVWLGEVYDMADCKTVADIIVIHVPPYNWNLAHVDYTRELFLFSTRFRHT